MLDHPPLQAIPFGFIHGQSMLVFIFFYSYYFFILKRKNSDQKSKIS